MQLKLDLQVKQHPRNSSAEAVTELKGTIDVDAGEVGNVLGQVLSALLAEIRKDKSVPSRRT